MFDESEHPRDKDGKFTNGNGATSGNLEQAIDVYSDNPEEDKKSAPIKSDTFSSSANKQMSIKNIKNKTDFVNFIEQQSGVKLVNDEQDILNKKRNLLYTKISREHKNSLLNFLRQNGFETNEHTNDYYWINIKSNK